MKWPFAPSFDLITNSVYTIQIMQCLPANTTLLSLRSNHIAELHNNAFLGLAWLRELDLSDNVVETVYPSAFQGLQDSLLFLNLSGNQLQTLSKIAFQQLKASIRLDGNPLHCGCDLQEVLNSIHLDPGTKSHLTCVTSQQEKAVRHAAPELVELVRASTLQLLCMDVICSICFVQASSCPEQI
uniref:Leucine rich repeat containing 3 n=1 Tax=Eptatretus burgeri TaxID=7764 RepID=A0A8C4WX35_EPTBU